MHLRHAIAMVPLMGAAGSLQVGFDPELLNPNFCDAYWHVSPNVDQRPPGVAVDTIVLHHTACDAAATIRHFSSFDSNVSAHFTVDRDGSILQHVSPWNRAWHAGVSRDRQGRESVNDFSVGIEIVNRGDGFDPYPAAQVDAVKKLIEAVRKHFPIKHIVSHSAVAMPPGRKNDPKDYPWESLFDLDVEFDIY